MARVRFAAVLFLATAPLAAQQPAYRDPSKPVETRVRDLLSRMTFDEKFWQRSERELDEISASLRRGAISYGGQVSAARAVALLGTLRGLCLRQSEHGLRAIRTLP